MKRNKLVILPQLYNCSGDINGIWFVYYSVLNPRTNKMRRKKDYAGLSKFSDVSSRTRAAEK